MEQRLLSDADFFEEFELIENELIDEYVHQRLSDEERALFEKHLLKTPQQQQKVAFANVLSEAAAERVTRKTKVVSLEPQVSKGRFLSSQSMKIAAGVVVVLGLGLAFWLLVGRRPSDVDRGMLALNQAYKNERLVESRISKIDYSPLSPPLRGTGSPNIDVLARNQAEVLLSEAARTRKSAASHHALGRLYLAEKKFADAKQQFEQALTLDPNNAELHSDMAAALLELGKAERNEDPGKAAESFGKSLEHINRALQLNNSSLEALFNRGLVLRQLMLLPAAEDAWRTYLQKDATSPWADEARRQLKLIEEERKRASENTRRLHQQFLQAYEDHDRVSAWTAIAQSRSRMGNRIVERLLTQYLEAGSQGQDVEAAKRLAMITFAGDIEAERAQDLYTADLAAFYSRATPLQRAKLVEARELLSAGLERYNQSEFDKAITLYTEAVRKFKALNSPEALFAESWLGYCELRREAKGERTRFERLAATFEKRSYRSLLAQAIHAQSDAWTDKNELSKVLDLAGHALKISEAIQDDSTRLRCLQQFVSMNLKFGKYLDSLRHGLSAIEISQSFLSEPKLIWTFYHELAWNFQLLGLPAAALEFEARALELAKQSAWPLIMARSYTQLGLIYHHQGDYGRAISNGLQAVAEGQKVEDEKSRFTIVSHAMMRLGHSYRQVGDFDKALAQYDNAVSMFEQLDLGVFRYETHKGKFIALVAVGNTAAAAEELNKALVLFEQYRTKIQQERNRNSFFDVEQDIYDLAIDFAYTKLNQPEKAFDYAEQSRARSLLGYLIKAPKVVKDGDGPDLQYARRTRALPFAELRERIPGNVQLLQYSVANEKLFSWVVTHNGIESSVVPISKQRLDEQIAGFVKQIANNAVTNETIGTAAELYAILIENSRQFLDQDKHLYIVPDKNLVQLPFGALKSSSDGKFLLERFSLAFTPSTNVFVECTENAQSKANIKVENVLAVGNPSFSTRTFPDLPHLPAAEREAREVASCYQSLPLLGGDAREHRVRSGMKNADLIHLASHFVVNQRSPMLSKLLLANEKTAHHQVESNSDGLLEVSEIYEMQLPRARLAVLSACQTGVEKTYQGEGAMSIARSFISAGVPLVVATLWPVESESTSELMIKFHHYRKHEGLATVDALRQAQIEMITSKDQTRSTPNAWASFVTIGGYADF